MTNSHRARIVLAAAFPESELSWWRFPADPDDPPMPTGFGNYDPQARHGGCTALITRAHIAALLLGQAVAIDVREYVVFMTIGD